MREESGLGSAQLCRVEHIVAWVLRGAQWQFERPWEVDAESRAASGALVLVRHRAGEATSERFESAEELRAWASRGGPWARTDRGGD